MRNLHYLLLAVLATPALAADPDTLKQYQIARQAFYGFDTNAYKSFSCHIDVSNLHALIASIKPAIDSHPGTLQETDNLADYTLTMDHSSGLSITKPSMDITILDEKKIADPARMKLGIQQMKDGFDKQVDGVNQVITGLFDGFVDKQPDIISVTQKGKQWIVRSQKDGVTNTETIDGSHVHDETGANGVSVVADSDYAPVPGGKLALQKAVIRLDQGPQNSLSALSVTYQQLGALQVPASIISEISLTIPGVSETKITVNIIFQNCSINN